VPWEAIVSGFIFVAGLLIGYGKISAQATRIDSIENLLSSKADNAIILRLIDDLKIEIRALRDDLMQLFRDNR
jgi:hypothetical protein